MAGSVTLTSSEIAGSGGIRKYALAWVSDASGAVSGTSHALAPGTIVIVEFVSDSGGTQPTSLYDVDFLDDHGASMFDDGTGTTIGANLSNTIGEHRAPLMVGSSSVHTYVRAWLHGGTYQLTVANAGNAKGGTVNIFQAPGVL